jgi:hypothetical protein
MLSSGGLHVRRHGRELAGRFLVLVAVVFAEPADASADLAGEVLTLEQGSAPGEVVLHWTGGASPWEVFRSTNPATVVDPTNRLTTTTAVSWPDTPPPGDSPVFYQVVSCATPASPVPHGCVGCDVCDAWGLSWAPVACTSRYVVRWACVFNPEQAWDVFATSVGDICFDIGMCDRCGSGVQYIRVQACNGSGCSVAVDVPDSEIPSQCGGGCCVP